MVATVKDNQKNKKSEQINCEQTNQVVLLARRTAVWLEKRAMSQRAVWLERKMQSENKAEEFSFLVPIRALPLSRSCTLLL